MKRVIKIGLGAVGLCLVYVSVIVVYTVRPWVPTLDIPEQVSAAQESRTYLPEHQELGKQWEKQLPQWREQAKAPSLSLAVGHKGKMVWAGVVGYKNVEQKAAARLTTRYRIGSTSKALTATGLAILYDRQQVSLTTPIRSYLPQFPDKGADITLRQLMSHQAGIRHYQGLWMPPFHEYVLNDKFTSVEQGLGLFKDDPLVSIPGEAFNYSSYGVNLASAVMEEVSQRPFLNFMQETVFQPLDMNNTYGDGIEPRSDEASWYQVQEDGRIRTASDVNSSYKWASGGFVSTPTDLVKLGNAWMSSSLFNADTKQLFFTPQPLTSGEVNPQNYALGWRSGLANYDSLDVEVTTIHHGGTAQGSTTFLIMFPKYDLVVAASMNGLREEFGALSDVCNSVAEMFILDSLDSV